MKKKYLLGGGLLLGWIALSKMIQRHRRRIDVKGRIVLITGGSRGLGLVMARQLASEGARVVICAREEKELLKAAEDLSVYTDEFLTISCDIGEKEDVKRMFAEIRSKMGEVEILINNAGTIQVGPMETMTEKDYEAAMSVHFWGPFYVVNEALPGMVGRRSGRIVNIISINGKVSFPHLLPYTVSKYALSGFSEGSSAELARHNIRVTSVYPGLMRTGSPRNIDVKGKYKREYAWFKISGSLPFLSTDAESAAGRIIRAMKAGEKILTIGIPARLAIGLEGIYPELNLSFFELANRLLPRSNGSGTEARKGHESETVVTSSFVTNKTDKRKEQ